MRNVNEDKPIEARDVDDRIIRKTDRVKPVGNLSETKALYRINDNMLDLVKCGSYFRDITIQSEKLIEVGGFNWHPSDVQIERKLIILPPIESGTFNIDNLDIK